MDHKLPQNRILFWRRGEPWIWLSGSALAVILAMAAIVFAVIFTNAVVAFWPQKLAFIETRQGQKYLGEVVQFEHQGTPLERLQLKVGNRDIYGLDFVWVKKEDVAELTYPPYATGIERQEHGNLYGFGKSDAVFLNRPTSDVTLETVTSQSVTTSAHEIVRVYRPNAMSFFDKLIYYWVRMVELFTADPRESNTEGGLFPAIFGTVMLVFLMSVLSFPFGVLAGIYLREYAKDGIITTCIRIAINNLAGIPSIVFGIFGLGFFVYGLGGSIDKIFFSDSLPAPTFGTGGILWASLTLGIMTIPVVIVATEEALDAIPRGLRDASLALGASKLQTLFRTLLPVAVPGIMTGFILAIARAAGEVAPLMITGVVKLAPDLPIDGQWPFFHFERKFMHLGFHIFDISAQSPNVEAAKPMVYVTAMLLLAIVLTLSALAIYLRNRMRSRFNVGV